MASYVERVLDFFEKLVQNNDTPKHLKEDIQWAIDVISANKLYVGGLEGFKLSEDKPEVKAWTDLISLRNLPVNRLEMERLKQYEISMNDNKDDKQKPITFKKSNVSESTPNMKKKKDSIENGANDESKLGLLN